MANGIASPSPEDRTTPQSPQGSFGAALRGRRLRSLASDLLLSLTIALVGGYLLWPRQLCVATDMSWYLSAGLNLHNDWGYVDHAWRPILMRGPLFPSLLAAAFWIFGVSVVSGYLVVGLFAAANPVALYLLGRRVQNRAMGLMAALLALTSYPIGFWSVRHLDHIWPFFLLVGAGFYHRALQRGFFRHFAIAGLLAGLSFITKEFALLGLLSYALANLLFPGARDSRRWLGLLLAFLMFCLPFLVWSALSLSTLGALPNPFLVTLTFLSETSSQANGIQMAEKFPVFLEGIWLFFQQAHRDNWPGLAWLTALSWTIIAVGAARRRPTDSYLLALFVPMLPVAAFAGTYSLRVGQGVSILLLSCLAQARAIQLVVQVMAKRKKQGKHVLRRVWLPRFLPLLLVIAIVTVQLRAGTSNARMIASKSNLSRLFEGKSPTTQITGAYALPWSQAISRWIRNSVPRGAVIMADWNPYSQAYYFLSGGDNPILPTPDLLCRGSSGGKLSYAYNYALPPLEPGSLTRPRVIFVGAAFKGYHPTNGFLILLEADLQAEILQHKVEYIVLSPRRNCLTLYFDPHPGYEKILEFEGGLGRVYRVLDPMAAFSGAVLFSQYAQSLLVETHSVSPERYRWYRDSLFEETLGWDEGMLESIQQDRPTEKIHLVYEACKY